MDTMPMIPSSTFSTSPSTSNSSSSHTTSKAAKFPLPTWFKVSNLYPQWIPLQCSCHQFTMYSQLSMVLTTQVA